MTHSDPSRDSGAPSPTPGFWTGRDAAAAMLLVAILVGMFWKVIFTSAMFFYRDVYNYTFPSARFIHDLLRQGFLPYWNPYLNYGQPVLANPNLLFFYPFTLLIILLPIDIAFTMHFLVHFAVAGIGVYVLARKWGQTVLGAFFAAAFFILSGPVLSLGNFYNEVACVAWIPWALLLTGQGLESRQRRPWVLLIVVFSLQWLAGEPFTMLATFGLCLAYAFYRWGDSSTLWSKPNFRVLAIFFLLGAGMMLLCAAQILPASDLLSQSRRGVQGLRFRETANWAVHPFSLAEMVVPDFFGAGVGAPTRWLWLMSDSNVPYLLSVFIGFVPLFFALAGWALGRDRRRKFLAGAAGAFLLLSFGHFTPVFALAYLLCPPLTVVRYPIKLLIVVTFLLAILAGWGFDALRSSVSPSSTQIRRLLIPLKIVFVCIVAALGVAWLLPATIMSPTLWALKRLDVGAFDLHQMPDFLVTAVRYTFPGLAGFCLGAVLLAHGMKEGKSWVRPGIYAFALLALGQLASVNYDANPTVAKSFFDYRPPVLERFKDPPGTYRVASLWPIVLMPDTRNVQTYVNFDSVPEAANFGPAAQGAFQARLQLAAGAMLSQVEGNINLDIERSMPPYLYDVEIYQSQHAADALRVDCLLGRTNVKYIIRPTPADSVATRPLGEVFNGSPMPSRLYEDLCFVPRAYVAGNALFSVDSRQTLDHLASPAFDALNTVILASPAGAAPNGEPALSPAGGGAGLKPEAAAGQVEIVHRDPNSVTLHAQLSRPGYVVLLDRFDPDWQATVDGHPARVFRANQIFRAVYAGAGVHEIRFAYHQRGLRAGIIISVLTFATLALLWFKSW